MWCVCSLQVALEEDRAAAQTSGDVLDLEKRKMALQEAELKARVEKEKKEADSREKRDDIFTKMKERVMDKI